VNVRVRPAEAADAESLVEFTRTVEVPVGVLSGTGGKQFDAEQIGARLRSVLAEPDRALLVAVDDTPEHAGRIVGVLVARTDDIGVVEATPVLHVLHLVVAPGQRRRGVGRALLCGAVHLAEERGVERVLATVASSSREGNRYLARLGFAPLVVNRVASTSVLRRALGMSDGPERMAVLRRARLIRAQRSGLTARIAHRGA